MILNIVILAVGIILYFNSPDIYNFPICSLCLVFFLFTAWDLLKDDLRNKNFVTFNMFFLLSFFLTSFCFPVFVMNSNSMFSALEDASMVVFRHVNYNWITKATCLCLIAISLYAIGFKWYKYDDKPRFFDSNEYNIRKCKIALIISALLVLGNMVFALRSTDFNGFTSKSYFYEIFDVLLAIYFIAQLPKDESERSVKSFVFNNRLVLYFALVICILFMSFNERGSAITILLIVLAAFALYKKISGVFLLSVIVAGSISMYMIRLAKMANVSFADTTVTELSKNASANESPLLIFSDLIGAEMELCVSYEIKETMGLQKPEQIVLIPFMPIPVLPSVMSQLLFNTTYDDARAAQALNVYMSDYGATFGKHCVGDIYMRWGIVGIFVFFLVFGYFVGKFCVLKDRNQYYLASFFILLSLSIYIPRSSLIDIIRPLFYIYIFSLLLSNKNTSTY